MAKLQLADFPTELLAGILHHLPYEHLASFSRVSKQFCTVSEPFIYKTIKLLGHGNRIPLLFRTLISRPELALHIHHFELSKWEFRGNTDFNLMDDEWQFTRALIAATNIIPEQSGLHLIEQGEVDAGVALVLSMCANLKSLHLVFDCPQAIRTFRSWPDPVDQPVPKFAKYTSNMLQQALKNNASNSKSIPWSSSSLREVKFGAEGTHVAYTLHAHLALSQCLPLFYFPNIQKLTFLHLETQKTSIPWPTISRPCASSLIHLALIDTALAGDALGDLLQACPNLKYLEYRYLGDDERNEGEFECDKAIQALWHINKALEHLVLDVVITASSSAELWGSDCGIRQTMNFSHFPNLKHLQTPIAVLLGMKSDMTESPDTTELADVLPSCIRKLEVTDGLSDLRDYEWEEEEMCRYLGKYVMTKNMHNPHLEAIKVVPTFNEDGSAWWPAKTVEKLDDICKVAGVAFDYTEIGGYYKPSLVR